jgi:diacylglycerol kinase (ATP)
VRRLNLACTDLDVRETSGKGDGVRLARAGVDQSYDMIFCAGGDGTVNEVINGMVGSGVPLGIIPLGTGNGFARELGLSTRPMSACEALRDPVVKTIPLGRVDSEEGGRHFALLAGAGIDSFTLERIDRKHSRLKRNVGFLSYFWAGLLSLFRYPYPSISFVVDGKEHRGSSGAVAKGRLWIGKFPVAPVELSDPSLCLCLIEGTGAMRYLRIALFFLLSFGRIKTARYITGKTVEIRSAVSLPYQVDGEVCGILPVSVTVVPNALRVVYPKQR